MGLLGLLGMLCGFESFLLYKVGFPGGSLVKNLPVVQETWVRKSPLEENGNPLQYSCLDRGAWQATTHGVTQELDMT